MSYIISKVNVPSVFNTVLKFTTFTDTTFGIKDFNIVRTWVTKKNPSFKKCIDFLIL